MRRTITYKTKYVFHIYVKFMYVSLENACQPSCIARRNQYSGHFSGREIQVYILNP